MRSIDNYHCIFFTLLTILIKFTVCFYWVKIQSIRDHMARIGSCCTFCQNF